jgi:hypothetical protein
MRALFIVLPLLSVGCTTPHHSRAADEHLAQWQEAPVATAWIAARVNVALHPAGWQFVAQGARPARHRPSPPASTVVMSRHPLCIK